jgi:hypothetical protein
MTSPNDMSMRFMYMSVAPFHGMGCAKHIPLSGRGVPRDERQAGGASKKGERMARRGEYCAVDGRSGHGFAGNRVRGAGRTPRDVAKVPAQATRSTPPAARSFVPCAPAMEIPFTGRHPPLGGGERASHNPITPNSLPFSLRTVFPSHLAFFACTPKPRRMRACAGCRACGTMPLAVALPASGGGPPETAIQQPRGEQHVRPFPAVGFPHVGQVGVR